MSENNKNAQNGARKPLFSIQVDDLIIQRIFKTLEDEICKIRVDITGIQAEITEKSNKNDLIELKADVREFKEKFDTFKEKIENDLFNYREDVKMTVNEMKTFVNNQISEATFSVNNVVRAQNALIEEKIFQLSQPNDDVNHILADVDRIKRINGDLSTKLHSIESFFSSFLNNTTDSNKTLPQIIEHYFEPDREKIRNIENHQRQADSRIQECETNIHTMFGADEIVFPSYGKSEKHPFHIKPKIPTLPAPKSYTDYFQYMMTVFPFLQKVLSSFYHQIVGLSNTVYDQAERETSQEDLEKALQELTDTVADVRELKESNLRIDTLSFKVDEIVSSTQPQITDILNELKQLKEATFTKDEINDEIKKGVSSVIKEIQLLKMENSFKSQSHQITKPSNIIQKRFSSSSLKVYNNNKNSITDLPSVNFNTLNSDDEQKQQPQKQQIPSSISTNDDNKSGLDSTATSEPVVNNDSKSGGSSVINSPNGSANRHNKVSSANPSPRIAKPELHVQSSAASTVSVPDPVIAAVQPRGRASYRMIFGDSSSNRPSSAASSVTSYSSSRMANLTNLNVQTADDLEEGGRAPKRTQKTANQVQISAEGLPEERDDSFDFFNVL